jgi:hypothetical protein
MDDPEFESQHNHEIFILPKGAQPTSYSVGTEDFFSRALSEWGERLLDPPPNDELKNYGYDPALPA